MYVMHRWGSHWDDRTATPGRQPSIGGAWPHAKGGGVRILLLDCLMIELMIEVGEERFGRPHRDATAEEVAIAGPDPTSRSERERHRWHVVRVTRNAPPRLADVLGIVL